MDKAELLHFIKRTEELITPATVGRLYQRAEMLGRLPVSVQRWIAGRAGDDEPYMGFVVEPYSFFLSYQISDEARARSQLPPGYELVPTAMFEGSEPRACGIVAAFNVHSSVFWGTRVESYLIAENTQTGLLSWVICDYESNTISYDPGRGFSGSSTIRSVVTTSHAGELIVDVQGKDGRNRLESVANLEGASTNALDQRLWLEGNLSVDYGGRLAQPDTVPFGLIFDPGEVERGLKVELDAVAIRHNTFGDGLLAAQPFEVCVFPYAQHFQTTRFPAASPVRTRADLEKAAMDIVATAA